MAVGPSAPEVSGGIPTEHRAESRKMLRAIDEDKSEPESYLYLASMSAELGLSG